MTDQATPMRLTVRQFAILDALYALDHPIMIDDLALHVRTPVLRREQIFDELWAMRLLGLVDNKSSLSSCRFWFVTEKGKAKVIVNQAEHVFDPSAETNAASSETTEAADETPAPASATVCNAPEEPAPATAILHIDEDELDGWWNALEIDDKSEAFAYITLGRVPSMASEPSISVSEAVFTQPAPEAVKDFIEKHGAHIRSVLTPDPAVQQ